MTNGVTVLDGSFFFEVRSMVLLMMLILGEKDLKGTPQGTPYDALRDLLIYQGSTFKK